MGDGQLDIDIDEEGGELGAVVGTAVVPATDGVLLGVTDGALDVGAKDGLVVRNAVG